MQYPSRAGRAFRGIGALFALTCLAVGCAREALPPVASTPEHRGVPPYPAAYGLPLSAPSPTPDVGAPLETGTLEDHVEDTEPLDPATAEDVRSPLEDLSDDEIARLYDDDPSALGSLSIGRTNGGRLVNGIQMPEGEGWTLIDEHHAWGTRETVDYLIRAIDVVRERYPDAPKLQIGHISAKNGGPLSPHKSHQAGRDVDISYFYTSEKRWFAYANASNLDVERTWAFVRALVTETDVHMILIDSSIQRLLRDYAESIGEDQAWLDEIFQYKGNHKRPIIRHVPGHATHIHIRFYNPVAEASAQRAYAVLLAKGKVKPPVLYVSHTAKKGDTLGSLARKYGTTVQDIQKANGLKNTKIFAKKTYRIPKKGGGPAPAPETVQIPPRRLPPPKSAQKPPPVASPPRAEG